MTNNPLSDWAIALNQVGLTGCLTNKYSSASINKYLSGFPFLATELLIEHEVVSLTKAHSEQVPLIEWIQQLNLHQFRNKAQLPIKRVDFSQINLIHGKNGAGKTSILEAIEFALTNQIRSANDVRDKSTQSMSTNVICLTKDKRNGIMLASGQKPAFYKSLETAWYGTSTGAGKTTINDQFFRFNYFDVHSAYKFILEESLDEDKRKEPDLIQKFSRLLFDESIISMEKNWTRFAREFKELVEKKESEIEYFERELRWDQEYLLEKEKRELERINYSVLTDLLRMTRYRSATDIREEYLPQLAEVMRAVAEHAATLKTQLHEPYCTTIKFLQEEKQRVSATYAECQSQGHGLAISMENTRMKLGVAKKALIDSQNQVKETELQLELYHATREEWAEIRQIIQNTDEVEKFRLREQTIEALKNLNTSDLVERVRKIDTPLMKLDDIELKALVDKLKIQKQKLQDRESHIHVLTDLSSQLKELKTKLSAMGIQILGLSPRKDCPLCCATHESETILRERIESGHRDKDHVFQQLLLEKDELTYDVRYIETKLESNRLHQMVMDYLNRYPVMQTVIYSQNGLILESDPVELFRYWVKVINLDNIRNSYASELLTLEQEGYNNGRIEKAQRFSNMNSFYLTYKKDDQYSSFESYLNDKLTALTTQHTEASDLVNHWEGRIKLLLEEDLALKDELNALDIRISHLGKISGITEQLNLIVQIILRHFDVPEGMSLSEWMVAYEELRTMLERYQTQLSDNEYNGVAYYQKRIKDNKERLTQLKEQLARIQSANMVFDSLKPLATYTQHIVGRHATEINRYYRELVQPDEEISVEVNPTGITLMHISRGVQVFPFELSTGQRTALTLSVLFALHTAAFQAPDFIMFDEVAAHLDDGHTNRLLDVLAALAAQGKQILFTTSNPDTANKFKERFSSFGSNFYREIAL